MVEVTQVLNSAGEGTAVPLNRWQSPFEVTCACEVAGGSSLTYSLQYTLDNVNDASVTPTWFDTIDVASETATAVTGIVRPVRAVRVEILSYTSGSVTFRVMQSGSGSS
jgi:hypothetical protein